MIYFEGTNFSKMYFEMLNEAYHSNANIVDSRIGKVKDLGPCVYQISEDQFRLCYIKERAINPFFALAEFSWIISGSNELQPLQYFISNYNNFSDDRNTLNGAYGYRLRNHFGTDQIEKAIEQLKTNPQSRRVVLTMWSVEDLTKDSKDIPCNTTIYLKIRDNKLDITITNRSNDLYLGVPYNVFVFYLLQSYIANELNLELGIQTHFTDSLHLYEKNFLDVKKIIDNNSYESIDSIQQNIQKFNTSKCLNISHNDVISFQFTAIKDPFFLLFFQIFDQVKNKNSINTKDIPNNILGYCIYNWVKQKKWFTETVPHFENYQSKRNIQLLETIKHESIQNIEDLVIHLSHQYLSKSKYIIERLIQNARNSIFSLLSEPNELKLIQTVLLSIILDSLSSNLYNKTLREQYMDKIRKISDNLLISIDDVFKLSYSVEEWKYIFNSTENNS